MRAARDHAIARLPVIEAEMQAQYGEADRLHSASDRLDAELVELDRQLAQAAAADAAAVAP